MIRPTEMTRDAEACLDCGMCEEIAVGTRWDAVGVPVTAFTLDAMAACPVGAIVWREGDSGHLPEPGGPVRGRE